MPHAAVQPQTVATVYIVEDDEAVRDSLTAFLDAHGLSAEGFTSAEDYLAAHAGEPDGCLLLDLNLPGMNGLDLLEQLRATGNAIPSVIFTARRNAWVDRRAGEVGASAVFDKPIDLRALLAAIRTALDRPLA